MGRMFDYGGDIFEAVAAFTTRIISVEYHKKSLAVFPVRRGAVETILFRRADFCKFQAGGRGNYAFQSIQKERAVNCAIGTGAIASGTRSRSRR
jgi:hypothetical protein